MSMRKCRNQQIDILRGTAVLLMVWGHCIQFGSGSEYLQNNVFFQNNIFKFIYTFHMPLFMVLSGYLFNNTIERYSENGWGTCYILKNKLRSLVLPIVTFGVLSELLQIVKTRHINVAKMTIDFIFGLKDRFWFLGAAFFACMMVLAINRLFGDNLAVYVISVIASMLIPESWGLSLILFVYPHFLFGYLYGKYNWKEQINCKRYYVIPLMLVIYVICFLCYDEQTYIYIGGLSLLSANWEMVLYRDLVRFMIGLTGAFLWCELVKKLTDVLPQVIKSIVTIVGQNSIGVYIVSSYLNLYVLMKITCNFKTINLFLSVLEMIGVTVISMIIIKIIESSNVLNLLLFGKKV